MNKKKKHDRIVRLRTITAFLTGCLIPCATSTLTAEPWSFGVHGDLQWTISTDPSGENPNYVSAAIARALNQQFIEKNVKFVIQVGDLSDRSGDAAKYTRADIAQPLYDQGIGFFPLRGNHDTYGTKFGLDPEYNLNIPAYLDAFPQTRGIANTYNAHNFSSPEVDILKGLSYSFDYGCTGNNARFVIVDVEQTSFAVSKAPVDEVYGQGYFYEGFTVYKAPADYSGVTTTYNAKGEALQKDLAITISAGTWFRIDSKLRKSTNFYAWDMVNPEQKNDIYKPIDEYKAIATYDPSGTEFWPGTQQSWISGQLDKATRGTEHAFVFSHRGLMGTNHVDCLFGTNPGSKAATQEPFYASLMNNGVRYMISGHDHIHNRAMVKSPDGSSSVQQIISTGASSKFYTPGSLSSFPGNVKSRETPISQEIYTIGYYIYTVDGPSVTVDYYSDSVGNFKSDQYYPRGNPDAVPPVPGTLTVPDFNFVKKETWGYSLNGKQFLVPQNQTYTTVADTFGGTVAAILSGTNTSTKKDYVNRSFTKSINTGWASDLGGTLKSKIVTLWGIEDFGTSITDSFTLSLSFTSATTGSFALATKNASGNWTGATDKNTGGASKFIIGSYKSTYPLGTYGIDPVAKTVWAVINHSGTFAVTTSLDGDLNSDGFIDNSDIAIVTSLRNQPAHVKPAADFDNDGIITLGDAKKLALIRTR